jgi:hypothetical protein
MFCRMASVLFRLGPVIYSRWLPPEVTPFWAKAVLITATLVPVAPLRVQPIMAELPMPTF